MNNPEIRKFRCFNPRSLNFIWYMFPGLYPLMLIATNPQNVYPWVMSVLFFTGYFWLHSVQVHLTRERFIRVHWPRNSLDKDLATLHHIERREFKGFSIAIIYFNDGTRVPIDVTSGEISKLLDLLHKEFGPVMKRNQQLYPEIAREPIMRKPLLLGAVLVLVVTLLVFWKLGMF